MAAVSVVTGFPSLWPDELCVKQMSRKVVGVCSVGVVSSTCRNKSDLTVVTAVFRFLLRESSRLLMPQLTRGCRPFCLDADALLLLQPS